MAQDPYANDPTGAEGGSGAPVSEEELVKMLAARNGTPVQFPRWGAPNISPTLPGSPSPTPSPSTPDPGTTPPPDPSVYPGLTTGTTSPSPAVPQNAPAAGGGAMFSDPGSGAGSHYTSIWDKIWQRANQGTFIDQNDPNFRQQADTFAAAGERSRRNAIADNAEAMSAQMLGGSGAQAVANRSINEGAQQAQSTFEAELVAKELQQRRDEIQQALNIAANMGNAEEQRALTRELGLIDAQLRAAGIQSNERIANNNLGYNYTALEAGQNSDALRALLAGL